MRRVCANFSEMSLFKYFSPSGSKRKDNGGICSEAAKIVKSDVTGCTEKEVVCVSEALDQSREDVVVLGKGKRSSYSDQEKKEIYNVYI